MPSDNLIWEHETVQFREAHHIDHFSAQVYCLPVMRRREYRRIVMLLLLPIGFLLFFTVGEVLSGDLSGLGHLLQLAPFLVLFVLIARWH